MSTHSIQTHTTTQYKIHVTGRIPSEGPGIFIHTYTVSKRPTSMVEAHRIAEEFESVDRLIVEEVSTTTNSRVLPLK